MALFIVTVLFLTIYAGLIFYYYYHWKNLKSFEPESNTPATFISVIVAARNEQETLPHLLKSLQNQIYPKDLYEVIIVNDFSTDGTEEAVKAFHDKQVKMIVPPGNATASSKKKAITAGIESATGSLMMITDADCRPQPEWLQTVASFYEQKKAVFIAAPVTYSHNQSLLQAFQAIDFMVLQGITAASVSANFHTMCNGANLAYTKKAFTAVNGFEGIDKVASGDDMLLMYKIWKRNKDKVLYLKSEKAIVTTLPAKTWKDFINQRRRWASKTAHYDDYRVLVVLLFIYLFNLLFVVLLIFSFVKANYWWAVLLYLVTKVIIELPFTCSVARFYKAEKIISYFIPFQPLHIFYTIIVGAISSFGKYEWKGRKTK